MSRDQIEIKLRPHNLSYAGTAHVVPTPGTFEDIVALGTENIREIIRFWRKMEKGARERTDLKEEWRRNRLAEAHVIITTLIRLLRQAERKPTFPCLRSDTEHFKLGQPVVCFIGTDRHNRLVKAEWMRGLIIDGPTPLFSQYTVKFPVPVWSCEGEPRDEIGWWNNHSPELLFEWELEYLIENPSYFGVWIHNIGWDKRVPSGMYRAILDEPESIVIA